MLRGIPKSDSILAAVSRIESLEAVSIYTASLARRTSMDASLLFVMEQEAPTPGLRPASREEIFQMVREAGEAEGVTIRCGIVTGSFTDAVAERLRTMDSPILVVGEGRDRRTRLRELNRIEKILKGDRTWSRRNTHHFLVVSRRKDGEGSGAGGENRCRQRGTGEERKAHEGTAMRASRSGIAAGERGTDAHNTQTRRR